MSTTPKTGMTELSNNSGQYLVMNGDLALIDQLLVPVVISRSLTSAPSTLVDGAMYIMASAWSGVTLSAGSIATAAGYLIYWRSSANAWTVMKPLVGQHVADLSDLDSNNVPRTYACTASGATASWSRPESGSSSGSVVTALTQSGGSVTVDCSLGNLFTLTPTAAVTSWTFTNVPTGIAITIVLTQGSSPYSVVMPTAKWVGSTPGTFSTAANAEDELSLSTTNGGTSWRAAFGKAFG